MTTRIVLLDSGPLGLLAHPRERTPIESRLIEWTEAGIRVVIPEIAYYEVRRELVRIGAQLQTERLDELTRDLDYAPITTPIIIWASILWAAARQRGRPTADPAALDGDVILASTGIQLTDTGTRLVVARFLPARNWSEIPAGDWNW